MDFAGAWGLLLVEGSIVASVFIIILCMRRDLKLIPPKRAKALSNSKKNLENNLEKINQLLKESETLSLHLSDNLAEKREIVTRFLGTLDGRIQSLNQLLEKIEGKMPAFPPGLSTKDRNDQILEMSQAGCGVTDIAKRLGLSKEEVQLILNLRKITAPPAEQG